MALLIPASSAISCIRVSCESLLEHSFAALNIFLPYSFSINFMV
jgi:hypothetical protein